ALNVSELGTNIVSVPQLYGTTYTLFGHVLPSQGITVRFAESDQPEAIEQLIDDRTRAVFCESVGNPAGNICDLEALARVAHAHGVPLIVDNTVATPILLKPIDYGADRVPVAAGRRDGGAAGRAPRGKRPAGRRVPPERSPGGLGQLRRVPRQPLSRPCAAVPRRSGLLADDVRDQGRLRGRQEALRRP